MLPRPPAINQITQPLPDGSPDIGWQVDCGEACVASILTVKTALPWSAGCIRQMNGVSPDAGTFAYQLADFLRAMGVNAKAYNNTLGELAYASLNPLRMENRYAIVLGNWDGLGGHWELFYHWYPNGCWVMNPNGGIYQWKEKNKFVDLYQGSYVVVTL